MVQTMSSSLFLYTYINFSLKNYLPIIHPFTANAPIRRLSFDIEYIILDLEFPLNIIEGNPLKEESLIFHPPFHNILYKDLSAL